MKIFSNNFIILCLFIFVIPFISCDESSTGPGGTRETWVEMPVPGSLSCSEIESHASFRAWAQATCLQIDKKYLNESRCSGGVMEVLCGDL